MCRMRIWSKWNPSALLLGMQNGTTTVENSVDGLPKIQIVSHHRAEQFYFRVYTKRTESGDSKSYLQKLLLKATFFVKPNEKIK